MRLVVGDKNTPGAAVRGRLVIDSRALHGNCKSKTGAIFTIWQVIDWMG
jgi:hypothetical protein